MSKKREGDVDRLCKAISSLQVTRERDSLRKVIDETVKDLKSLELHIKIGMINNLSEAQKGITNVLTVLADRLACLYEEKLELERLLK